MTDLKYLERIFEEMMLADSQLNRLRWANAFRDVWQKELSRKKAIMVKNLPKFHKCCITPKERELYELGLKQGKKHG